MALFWSHRHLLFGLLDSGVPTSSISQINFQQAIYFYPIRQGAYSSEQQRNQGGEMGNVHPQRQGHRL